MVRTRPRRWWLRLIGVLMVSGVGWVLYGQRVAGDMAPAFTLPSTTGGTVALDQYRGRQPVVLVFYLWRSALHTTRSGWRILQRLLIRRSSLPKTCPVPEQSTGMDCLWGTEGTRVPSHVFGLRSMLSLNEEKTMIHKYVTTVGLALALLGLASPVVFAGDSANAPVSSGVVATITAIDARTSMATLQTEAGEVFELPKEPSWHMGHKVECDRLDTPRPRLQHCQPWETPHAGDATARLERHTSSR